MAIVSAYNDMLSAHQPFEGYPQLIKEAVHKIREPQEVARIAREIKKLEEEGDALYSSAVGALFEGSPNALEVIKWKELYDNIEHALDESEDVLNVLESVSIKNS